ncbi:TPA: cob(I)yrinic acid a,c-diamide adenosyltransferase [Candidatus Saccharibacteria bacterium]|nr:cob(I)yrinic acid a,c-diamide adenosyltransferase [Candidatus Saccharibacteria bacterium]HIO87264.1 cob(I)yrinic acid a,c-diamide adenosyltransferase [Candidatus Saccharibacteria bacterium]
MAFEDFKHKDSVIIVYTGEGKGKTSAGLGLTVRALGTGWRVAFVQFIKYWDVGEHNFLNDASDLYGDDLVFYKGGKGFFKAGEISAKGVSEDQHKQAAAETYDFALESVQSGSFDLVVCDEINNAVNDGLLTVEQVEKLIDATGQKTSLCMTGRDFPRQLLPKVDIATNMTKIKHHFDDKYIANKGIDY